MVIMRTDDDGKEEEIDDSILQNIYIQVESTQNL